MREQRPHKETETQRKEDVSKHRGSCLSILTLSDQLRRLPAWPTHTQRQGHRISVLVPQPSRV